MSKLELLIPPPAVALVVAAIMWGASSFVPVLDISAPIRMGLAMALMLLGLSFDLAGLIAFRRARTTVNPMRPRATTVLLASGVYRLTRNPMYLGLLFVLIAWAVFLSSAWLLIGPLVFVSYMNRFQIAPEERVLLALFPDDYVAYKRRVRRWL